MNDKLTRLAEEIKAGRRLTYDETVTLAHQNSTVELAALANVLRHHFNGNRVDTCSIINARSGRCSEDCKWCSQSKFHHTQVEVYPLVSEETALTMARHNASKGVRRFSLVTSGRTMQGTDLDKTVEIFRRIRAEVPIKLCASMGLMSRDELARLYEAGVERYHCNLESAPSYFGTLCSTHTQKEKIETLKAARSVGMTLCSGGIIGMGESLEQRIELAVTLRDLGVDSIPVNVLNPIPGTPLEHTPPLSGDELLRSFALFRIVHPAAHIRFAGGRTLFEGIQREALQGGVSAAIVGDMLTTVGCKIDQDMSLFRELGFTTE